MFAWDMMAVIYLFNFFEPQMHLCVEKLSVRTVPREIKILQF